ncbi:MAG: VWA domain-containing protein, partial [Bacteroidota bacterium]
MSKEKTRRLWEEEWNNALKVWSDYVKLRPPEWCMNKAEAKAAGIRSSFAMIRLNDHRIVIDIPKLVEVGLEGCALQVLAHEIGHHIYTPANLKDNAQVLSKLRWSLAGIEDQAPMVANLYEDLLINDRLQRSKGLDMALVYRKVNQGITYSKLWTLYMRTYEYLWKLKRGELAADLSMHDDSIDADASLIASLIRSYSKDWLEGATRFGTMLYPYLIEEEEASAGRFSAILILDTEEAGKGGGIVAGLTEMDKEAIEG